jgi:hypothetical protein
MKNLRNKTPLAFFLLVITGLLLPGTASAQNSGLQYCTITATGTGKTTGDIVAMTIYNPSDMEVKGSLGPYYIPSGGSYQPYITTEKVPVTVPSGKTVYITLKGFCTDITKPAAGEKDNFKPINTWIRIDDSHSGVLPPSKLNINPESHPELAAPYFLGALEAITKAYDGMKEKGNIITPFSNAPEKEREAVIQQTFWIYAAATRQKPYTKEQFSTRTYEQYEEKTHIKPFTLPADKKQQLDKGIDDFWNTFQAVGTEAKILNTPSKPEDEKFFTPISGPQVTPCTCTKCEIKIPMRIIDLATNKEITADSVPWMDNKVRVEPPVVKCDCPEECIPYTFVQIRTVPHYKHHGNSGSLWWSTPLEQINIWDAGSMDFEAEYKCECANRPCGEGKVSRTIYFTCANDCNDSIKSKNHGSLSFPFNGGNAKISGNVFSIESKECGPLKFELNFNLETVFCNLSDDEVFSQLLSIMRSQTSGGVTTEYYSSTDLTMGGPSSDGNMGKFYGFGFSQIVDGSQVAVFIGIDKDKCVFDITIFCNGNTYGFAAPPYLSPVQLTAMANGLTAPTSGQSWTNALLILSQLARANANNQGPAYQQAMRNYLAKVLNQVTTLLSNTNNPQLKTQLQDLRNAAAECLDKGDFKLLDNVMQKMIPVANAMN